MSAVLELVRRTGSLASRETRCCALPGRLRRPPLGPSTDGDPRVDDQGRRIGAGALRRRLLQAAELDVAALQGHRGRDRGRSGGVDRKGAVLGKSVSVRVESGCSRSIKTKHITYQTT